MVGSISRTGWKACPGRAKSLTYEIRVLFRILSLLHKMSSNQQEVIAVKVWIDRDTCTSNLSACLSCFGQLVITGVPDRACIMKYEDDGSEDMTVYMKSEGHEEVIVIPKDKREMIAYEGWDKYVSFVPSFLKEFGLPATIKEYEGRE